MNARAVRWNEITAIFGGRFDPPHSGHLAAADGLFRAPGVQRVVLLPSANPPHKPAHAPFEDRLALCQTLARNARSGAVQVDDREERLARNSPSKPTYSFDVIQDLKKDFPKLAFVIGTDQLQGLPGWYRFPEILGLCHWIVLARKPWQPEKAQDAIRLLEGSGLISRIPASSDALGTWTIRGAGSENQLILAPTDAPDISSTTVRESLARTGDAPLNSLTPEVEAELKRRRIYGTQRPKDRSIQSRSKA